jgi:hypothetical protein
MDRIEDIRHNCQVACAGSFLAGRFINRDASGRRRPDGLIDRSLLAYPDAFGEQYRLPLSQARDCVLRDGDERSRELLEASPPADHSDAEIKRIKRILAGRPNATERTAPALVMWSEGLTIALAHPVPHASSSLSVRIQVDGHPEVVAMGAERVEASEHVLERWRALGYPRAPHSVWRCDPPSWIFGFHFFAVEIGPNPRGFNEAMLIAHLGAGRLLVPHLDGDANSIEARTMPASVLPSGWAYLRGERTMGSSLPSYPNGAPYPSIAIRVPDDDLFALCASMTWTASLRDAIWIRHRPDYRLFC